MSLWVFSIVLFAAFLHALWNAIVKGAGDRAIILALVALGHFVPGIVLVVLSPPMALAAIPYVIASSVIHWGYYTMLNIAYREGDLSVVYPIARGLAPILIAIGAVIFVNENLPLLVWCGIIAVSGGILLLATGAIKSKLPIKGLLAAVGVAVAISSYSVIDGIGVRLSGSPVAYIGWLFVAEILVTLYIFATRWNRVRQTSRRNLTLGLLGGFVSCFAYALVLLAKVEAPLGVVSALRETSVIFATLIGVLWFSEGPRRDRVIAAVIVSLGIVLIAIANGQG